MVILFIVLLAFLVGLNNLYWYYDPSMRLQVQVSSDEDNDDLKTEAEFAFGT